MSIRLIVYVNQSIYDDLNIAKDYIISNDEDERVSDSVVCVRISKKGFNSYLASAYTSLMKTSDTYRESAVEVLKEFIEAHGKSADNSEIILLMRLRTPRKQYLDYAWCRRLHLMAMERREIDYAMSWLSTLGGAFSAMGEQFDHHARIAGKISNEQFKLAIRLGDPLLLARCHLYHSLSLIQQKKFKTPRRIIPIIFQYANESKDKNLSRACEGVWAKLQYTIKLHRIEKNKNNNI